MSDVPETDFTSMETSKPQDWQTVANHAKAFNKGLADRVLTHLKLLDGDFGGFPVDRLTHSLQSATLAYRDDEEEEYVVCALLHDIGDTLASHNHPDVAAAILKPFVSEANHWMVEHHGVFQGYYFFEHLGLDKDMREAYRGHEHFARTQRFCAKHDQNAFDASYDTMPLEAFEPMLRRVFEKPKRSIYKRPHASTRAS